MISVRMLAVNDLAVRVQWFNTASIYLQMPLEPPFSLARTQEWYARIVDDERRRDFVFERETSNSDTQIVAMGGLVNIDHKNQRAELYIVVGPEVTGKGIGSRVVSWMCQYGFSVLNLQRIYLYTVSANERARHFYERLGFVQEGVMRKHLYHNGAFVDRYIHGLLKADWSGRDPVEGVNLPFSVEL